jgi:hypothetical protein
VLSSQNSGKEELQREVGQLNKELKALQGKLDAATKEVQQQKQVGGVGGWVSSGTSWHRLRRLCVGQAG